MSKLRRRFPRRWPMIRFGDRLAALMPKANKLCDAAVFRMFGIGDALLFRVVLEKYAEALNIPPDEVTVIGSTTWSDAARLFFRDVEIMAIDERRFARKLFYRLGVMRALRRRGFRTAICGMRFRYPHVIDSLMLATGAPRRVVAEARPNEKFDAMFAHYRRIMTQVVDLPEPERPRDAAGKPLPLQHEIERELAFLSVVAEKPISLTALPKLFLAPKIPPLVMPGESYAVLNIGASHAPRRWPLAYYAELARRLLGRGISVVILGGPSETGLKAEIDGLIKSGSSSNQARLIVSINEIDFPSAAQLVNHASLVVSNDTGIGHLAIMLDKPAVLLVGGGHFGSFMPYPATLTPPRVRFLYHSMPCYHCNWNCTEMRPGERVFPCVARIAVDDVWSAALEVLNKPLVSIAKNK
jgi:hypothetical protein